MKKIKNKDEKVKVIKQKIWDMEDETDKKIQQLKHTKDGGTVGDTIEVNDMLVESIKAKLAILNTYK